MAPGRRKTTERWSMYQELHDDVSRLLADTDLNFDFHDSDDDINCTKMRNTNIMGRFTCHNPGCRSKGWASRKIAITIRLYPGQKYNARVYHQRCKFCNSLSRPVPDESYAERVTYWIKQWNGVQVEKPPISGVSKGPHNKQLCEGCKAGRCTESGDDWLMQLQRSQVHPRVIGCEGAHQEKFDTLQDARGAMTSRGFTDFEEVTVQITEGIAGPLGHGKFYAVAGGRTTEVFTDWENAKKSINGTNACQERFRTQQEAEQFIEAWKDAYADVWRREIRQALDKGWKPKDMKFDAGLFLDRGTNNGTTKEDTEEKKEQSSRGADDDHELSKLEGLAIKEESQ
ncbi:zinc-binding domain-containing protein [Aspergillus minisclerotigenes]|uniref:Zinc-binding domain-containing protein n=1 Tax=Aspergillus minisclerotigenes TaxID=656917 RepID=A0A5N6IMY1_9EURO|nr:zinc-binding domain-containing protein [Aspergillus minisclerotigenes]